MSEALKKALEEKAKTFPDMLEENSQCCMGFINNCCDCKEQCGTELWVSLKTLQKDFVVVPRLEYDGQVHVPRKQLIEKQLELRGKIAGCGTCYKCQEYKAVLNFIEELLVASGEAK